VKCFESKEKAKSSKTLLDLDLHWVSLLTCGAGTIIMGYAETTWSCHCYKNQNLLKLILSFPSRQHSGFGWNHSPQSPLVTQSSLEVGHQPRKTWRLVGFQAMVWQQTSSMVALNVVREGQMIQMQIALGTTRHSVINSEQPMAPILTATTKSLGVLGYSWDWRTPCNLMAELSCLEIIIIAFSYHGRWSSSF